MKDSRIDRLKALFINRTVSAVSINSLIRSLGRYGAFITLPIYFLTVRDVSYLEIGLYFTVALLLAIPASVLGGNLVDHIGRKPVTYIVPLVLVLLYFITFIAILEKFSIYTIFLLFAAVVAASTVLGTADSVIITDSTTEAERNNAFSIQRIMFNLGGAAGPAVGGLIFRQWYPFLFLAMAITSFVEWAIYRKYVAETLLVKPSEGAGKRKRLSFPFDDRLFIIVSVLIALMWFMASTAFEGSMLPMFLSNIYSFSTFRIGILFSVNAIVVVLLQLPVNRLFVNWNSKNMIAIAGVFYAASFFIIGITANYIIILLDVVFLTIAENIMAPASYFIISKLAPEHRRGEYFGAQSAIASAIGPFSSIFGSVLLLYFAGVPLILWGILTIVMMIFSYGMFSVPLSRRSGRDNANGVN